MAKKKVAKKKAAKKRVAKKAKRKVAKRKGARRRWPKKRRPKRRSPKRRPPRRRSPRRRPERRSPRSGRRKRPPPQHPCRRPSSGRATARARNPFLALPRTELPRRERAVGIAIPDGSKRFSRKELRHSSPRFFPGSSAPRRAAPTTERLDRLVGEGHGERALAATAATERLELLQQRVPVDRVRLCAPACGTPTGRPPARALSVRTRTTGRRVASIA